MTLSLTEDGLEIPEEYQQLSQVVLRTPSNTMDMSSGFSLVVENGRLPIVQPNHFQTDENLENPDLSPDKISIKQYGETEEEFTVEIE